MLAREVGFLCYSFFMIRAHLTFFLLSAKPMS